MVARVGFQRRDRVRKNSSRVSLAQCSGQKPRGAAGDTQGRCLGRRACTRERMQLACAQVQQLAHPHTPDPGPHPGDRSPFCASSSPTALPPHLPQTWEPQGSHSSGPCSQEGCPGRSACSFSLWLLSKSHLCSPPKHWQATPSPVLKEWPLAVTHCDQERLALHEPWAPPPPELPASRPAPRMLCPPPHALAVSTAVLTWMLCLLHPLLRRPSSQSPGLPGSRPPLAGPSPPSGCQGPPASRAQLLPAPGGGGTKGPLSPQGSDRAA